MNLTYNIHIIRKVLFYLFWLLIIWRIFATAFVAYQYIITVAATESNKWGTLVEGIEGWTSYLPYVWENRQSQFYQWLLFQSCIKYDNNILWQYTDQLCSVETSNYQDFFVELTDENIRSDWTPVTTDDLIFTFEEIIKRNERNISGLEIFSQTEIWLEQDGRIKVSFPNRSIDNMIFFTNYILPRHILQDTTYSYYRENFASNPIYMKCTSIIPQTRDSNSLVFDLNRCSDTNIWFYQVKSYPNYQELFAANTNGNSSLVDVFQSDQWHGWYTQIPVTSHAYTAFFFNTKSPKVTVRLRRSLGWFLTNTLLSWSQLDNILEQNQRIFTRFLTEGENIQDFLSRITSDDSLSIQDLEDSWVSELTNEIIFNEDGRNYLYYTTSPQDSTINLTFKTAYDEVKVKTQDWEERGNVTNYSKTNKTANFTIRGGTLSPWLNTVIIYRTQDDKEINIWSVWIYLIQESWTQTNTWSIEQLRIVYQTTPYFENIIAGLKTIINENNIAQYFEFAGFESQTDMESALVIWDYDIALLNIGKWLRRDISPVFKSESPVLNPSQYTNPQFINLFEQFLATPTINQSIINELQNVYARDMPFILLWRQKSILNIKSDIIDNLQESFTGTLHEHSRRDILYENIILTNNISINQQLDLSRQSFKNFIRGRSNESQEIQNWTWSNETSIYELTQ